MKKSYLEFLESKRLQFKPTGIDVDSSKISDVLFDFQRDLVIWALRSGKAALFSMTGTGKTLMQLEWARHIPGNVLILTPLAVSRQTATEAEKMGLKVKVCRSQEDVIGGINITNYEKLKKFDVSAFEGVVLDESSILKSYDGKTKQEIISSFKMTPYKLAATATPAPNDYVELGNHAEFLDVMTQSQMLSTFFINDTGTSQNWRLKGHAEGKFWEWVSTWAAVVGNPNDLGYMEKDFTLPNLNQEEIIIKGANSTDKLFVVEAETLTERRQARKESLDDRVEKAAIIANSVDDQILVWCDLNEESNKLAKKISNAVEVKGSDSDEHKENAMIEFADGNIKALVTKPSICGHGMNWQNCRNMIFVGLSDSFERYFQSVRRCWRFGQDKEVNVYIIVSEKEGSVLRNIKRKQGELEKMLSMVSVLTRENVKKNIKQSGGLGKISNPGEEIVLPCFVGGGAEYESLRSGC